MTRLITKTYTIGRNAENDINPSKMPALDTERISRKHAVIDFYNDGTMDITDKSSNGTFVNEKRLQKDMPTPVRTSDVITLAGIRFRWQTLPEFEGMTDVSSSANTSYTPPAAPAPNRQPVQSAAAKQGFSWKIGGSVAAVVLIVAILFARDTEPCLNCPKPPIPIPIPIPIPDPAKIDPPSRTNNDNATGKIYLYGEYRYQGTDAKDIFSSGTGFLVNDSGYVVTNYHVIADYVSLENGQSTSIEKAIANPNFQLNKIIFWIKFPDLEKAANLELIGYDKDKDLAILKIDSKSFTKLQEINVRPVVLWNGEIEKGMDIYAIGYNSLDVVGQKSALERKKIKINALFDGSSEMSVFHKDQQVVEGTKDSVAVSTDSDGAITQVLADVINHDATLDHGQSGGPTFLKQNDYLIGVNRSYYNVVRNTNTSISSSELETFLKAKGISFIKK